MYSRVIKLKSVRWDGPFSTYERDEKLIKFLVRSPEKLRPLTLNPIQNYGNNFQEIFKKDLAWCGLNSPGSGQGQEAGSCKQSYENSGSIKMW